MTGCARGLLEEVRRGLGIANALGAHVALIRSGSLNPNGPYSPHRDNHRPACRDRLLDSLRWLAEVAEALGQTVVVETHLLTIMRSPEYNRAIIRDVGSARLRLVMDYVNHFQTLHQVYDSRARLRHIFDCMGPVSAIGHCKDIAVRDGFVIHMDEEIPGEGELDLATALRLWHDEHRGRLHDARATCRTRAIPWPRPMCMGFWRRREFRCISRQWPVVGCQLLNVRFTAPGTARRPSASDFAADRLPVLHPVQVPPRARSALVAIAQNHVFARAAM